MLDFFSQSRPNSDTILSELKALKKHDLPWDNGRVMAYVYEPAPHAYQLIQQAYMMFLTENGLDPTAFGSLLKMEQDVIHTALELMGGDEQSAGNFTFGGTESIMLAVKAARDHAREHRPAVKQPNIVLPVTAHAAFFKACHYLGLDTKIVAVDAESFTPQPPDIEAAIDENTLMLVASAPSYAHGVLDPVREIAALAQKHQLLCHVDACVGGLYLPFAQRLGYDIPAFDFSVEGVTSISADFHKYGYTAKGASCILYKNRSLRKYQIYSCSQWSGYSVVNPTVLSSKTGGSLAACWANMKLLGAKGYEAMVAETQSAKRQVEAAIRDIAALQLLGKGVMNMIAFSSDTVDVFAIAQKMGERNWYLQVQFQHGVSPTNIHLSINRANVPHIPEFIADLREVVAELESSPTMDNLPFSKETLAHLTPEMIQQFQAHLGIADGEVPKDLTTVNRILDAAPPHIRDMMLKEFMNGLLR